MNGSVTNAVASGVYSSFDLARSTPSARIAAWSKASGAGSAATGVHRASAASVPGVRLRQPGGEGQVGDGDDAHPRVTAWGAVAAELLKVGWGAARGPPLRPARAPRPAPGPPRPGCRPGRSRPDETAGQRPAAPVRRLAAPDEQHLELGVPDGQRHHVDGDRDRVVGPRVVARQEALGVIGSSTRGHQPFGSFGPICSSLFEKNSI